MDDFIDKMRVLLVDDHQMTRKTVRDLLLLLGIRSQNIEQAEDGEVAYRKLMGKPEELQFHIVVLDWHMPVMNGIELLKKCRTEQRLNKVAMIMLTAEDEKSHVIDAIRCGANSYIHKPFTVKAFEDKLKKVIELIRPKSE